MLVGNLSLASQILECDVRVYKLNYSIRIEDPEFPGGACPRARQFQIQYLTVGAMAQPEDTI